MYIYLQKIYRSTKDTCKQIDEAGVVVFLMISGDFSSLLTHNITNNSIIMHMKVKVNPTRVVTS